LPAKTCISDPNKQVLISSTMPPPPVLVPLENDMGLAELILTLDRPWPSPPMEGTSLRTMSLLVQRPMAWNVKTLTPIGPPPRSRARPPMKTIRQTV
ncbi:hypothetical protein LY76DRAFT_471838, partial [Colletotrichum caudatum]